MIEVTCPCSDDRPLQEGPASDSLINRSTSEGVYSNRNINWVCQRGIVLRCRLSSPQDYISGDIGPPTIVQRASCPLHLGCPRVPLGFNLR